MVENHYAIRQRFSLFVFESTIELTDEKAEACVCSNLAFAVEESSHAGVSVVARQNEAGFGPRAGALTHSRVHGAVS